MVRLAELADHEDSAIRAAWRKVEDRRPAVPEGYPLALVQALNELGAMLIDRDEHEPALAIAATATELSQIPGADAVPGARAEHLITLNVRAFALAGLGLDHEALHAAEDVVDAMRGCRDGELGAQYRDALSRLIMLQGEQGLHKEALAAADELTDLGRERYAADPAAHVADLVLGLHNRYAALMHLGRTAEATEALAELVAALEPLDPSRLLVESLSDLGYLRLQLGEPARALETLRTAVELARGLAAEDPAMNDSLAVAMKNLSEAMTALGEDVVPLLTEIVELLRRVEETGRDNLAGVLNNLAMALMRAARHREAMAAAAEAVELCRTAAPEGLALALWSFAEVRLAAGEELPEALAAIEESVALYEAQADEPNARAASKIRAEVLDALHHHAT